MHPGMITKLIGKQRDGYVGTGKRGDYESVFAGGISRISKISKFSRIPTKWSDPP